MARIRLLAALLLCSLSAFAQEQPVAPTSDAVSLPKIEFKTPAANPSEPWKIIPRQWQDSNSSGDVPGIVPDGPSKFKFEGNRLDLARSGVFTTQGDDICYTMRTYVVARDDQDSDSTHPVRSSTCQHGSRFHLKTADAPEGMETGKH